MPAGLFRDAVYKEYTMALPENFRLMLFSDGILEIIDESSLNDKETILLSLARESRGDLTTFWSLAGVQNHDEVPDDIAVATVSRGKI